MRDCIRSLQGEYPNSCNVNIYDDQSQEAPNDKLFTNEPRKVEVGWHSDDEVLFQGLAGDTRSPCSRSVAEFRLAMFHRFGLVS